MLPRELLVPARRDGGLGPWARGPRAWVGWGLGWGLGWAWGWGLGWGRAWGLGLGPGAGAWGWGLGLAPWLRPGLGPGACQLGARGRGVRPGLGPEASGPGPGARWGLGRGPRAWGPGFGGWRLAGAWAGLGHGVCVRTASLRARQCDKYSCFRCILHTVCLLPLQFPTSANILLIFCGFLRIFAENCGLFAEFCGISAKFCGIVAEFTEVGNCRGRRPTV